jgi:carboxymethylenebutenolidase
VLAGHRAAREALRRLCPIVGSWPEKDFTTSAAVTLETELSMAGGPHDLKVHPGARHSFFNDREATYDAAAAADSWRHVLAFFEETTSEPSGSRLNIKCQRRLAHTPLPWAQQR